MKPGPCPFFPTLTKNLSDSPSNGEFSVFQLPQPGHPPGPLAQEPTDKSAPWQPDAPKPWLLILCACQQILLPGLHENAPVTGSAWLQTMLFRQWGPR